MRNLFAVVIATLAMSPAFATIDVHDKVYLVVRDIQTEEFFIERAPIIGCIGLPQGPQLAQLTMEYKATSNIGCGDKAMVENINYLVCAKVVSAKESADYSSYSQITLDISKCDAKNDPEFLKVLHKAAKLNFPNKNGVVKLNLIK